MRQEEAFSKSKQYQPLTITITECLSEGCTGSYTDTISKSILVLCKDPKHNNQKQSAGQVTNQRPATEYRARTDTESIQGGDFLLSE